MRSALLVAFALIAGLPGPARAASSAIYITGATIIDGTGTPPRAAQALVLENGRIRSMGPAAIVAPPAGAVMVDAAGKFIVPGIINAHGHVGANPEPQLRQYALYGVTTTTSMATDPDDVVRVRDDQRRGILRGARVLTVKHRFMPDPAVATPEQARAKVDEAVLAGADFVKVWIEGAAGQREKLSPEFTAAVMEQGRRHGKITMAHIYEHADAEMIVERGVNILVHNVRDRELDPAFIETLKRRNVSVISTLAREEAMFVYADAPAWLDDPFFTRGLSAESFALLKTKKREEQAGDPQRSRNVRAFETDKRNLKRLVDAGVRVALGTDSGGAANRFFIQGFFEHRQMQLMVAAGLTPMQVIQSWSKGASEALGIDRDFGTLAPGKAADLLILRENPLTDIANVRTIEAVYLGGKKFE